MLLSDEQWGLQFAVKGRFDEQGAYSGRSSFTLRVANLQSDRIYLL